MAVQGNRLLGMVACGLAYCLSSPLQAAALGEETLKLEVGYFLTTWNTRVRVNNTESDNTLVDLESDLGFDEDDETFYANLEWRFADRHRLAAGYWRLTRTSSAVLMSEITVDEETYPVGARLGSEWEVEIIPISYSYSFFKSPRLEAAATIGVHWDTFSLDVRGDAFVAGTSGSVDGRASAEADAPLPLVGLRLDYQPWQRWQMGLLGNWFAVSSDWTDGDIEGEIINANAYLEFAVTGHFGLGAKYTYFSLDVDADEGNWQGELDFEYEGPQVYFSLEF